MQSSLGRLTISFRSHRSHKYVLLCIALCIGFTSSRFTIFRLLQLQGNDDIPEVLVRNPTFAANK